VEIRKGSTIPPLKVYLESFYYTNEADFAQKFSDKINAVLNGETRYRDTKATFSSNARRRKISLQIEADHTIFVSLSDALRFKLEFIRNGF
jgi:hypothetical protein